ncbi:MAG: hypothetical protein U0703_17070 [Anaerolineae bacterium]
MVKAVDFEISRGRRDPADALIAETLGDPAVVEIIGHDGNRYGIALEEQPAADGAPGLTLDKNTVFLVTGAAGASPQRHRRRPAWQPAAAASICSIWWRCLTQG